ncbi:MAG TPA: hypothetical protein VJZ27_03840 [Aggregatilineales bacterium]|nr:hypothetical protein [Aggregatilineales bacterium]
MLDQVDKLGAPISFGDQVITEKGTKGTVTGFIIIRGELYLTLRLENQTGNPELRGCSYARPRDLTRRNNH